MEDKGGEGRHGRREGERKREKGEEKGGVRTS
jgi:hypothetical protein